MDNMAYLQQIATPEKPSPLPSSFSLSSLFENKILRILLILTPIVIILSIAATVIPSMIASNKSASAAYQRNLVLRTKLRTDNLSKTLETYIPKLKSSALRNSSRNLSTFLNLTSRDLATAIAADYGEVEPSETLTTEEEEYIEKTNKTLRDAMLNARLDYNYARQITLEISLLLSLESEAATLLESSPITPVLETSTNNLSTLYSDFASFSDSNL